MRKTLIFGVAILLVSLFMACANSVAATDDPTDDVVGVQRYVYEFTVDTDEFVDNYYTTNISEIVLADMPMVQIYQYSEDFGGCWIPIPRSDFFCGDPCFRVSDRELSIYDCYASVGGDHTLNYKVVIIK